MQEGLCLQLYELYELVDFGFERGRAMISTISTILGVIGKTAKAVVIVVEAGTKIISIIEK